MIWQRFSDQYCCSSEPLVFSLKFIFDYIIQYCQVIISYINRYRQYYFIHVFINIGSGIRCIEQNNVSASYLHFQCAVFSIHYFKTTTQEKLKTIFKVLNHKISKQLSRIILLHVKIFRFFPPNILKLIIVLFYVSVFEYKFSKGFSLFLPIHNIYCGPILPPRIMF